jgi:uncharacterized protein YuzE
MKGTFRMRLDYDPEADAAYVALRDVAQVERTMALDDHRLIDYVGTQAVGVELLAVSRGVRLDDLPERDAIARLLAEQHLPGYA